MRVIRPASDSESATEAALRRLAAEMLNVESGAEVFSPALVRRPAPWAPYPTVELPPTTNDGQTAVVHYKPATGVIYYTRRASDELGPRSWVYRLRQLLDTAGVAHLEGPRATAATPQGVFRSRPAVPALAPKRTAILGLASQQSKLAAHREIRLPIADDFGLDPDTYAPPPLISRSAVFTWYVEPAAYLPIARDFDAGLVNAVVAGVLFDWGRTAALPDNAVTLAPQEVFKQVPFPAWWPSGRFRPSGGWSSLGEWISHRALGRHYGGSSTPTGLLVLTPAAPGPLPPGVSAPLPPCPPPGNFYAVQYVRADGALLCPPKDLSGLSEEAWDPLWLHQPYQCAYCGVSLGGPAVLVRGLRDLGGGEGPLATRHHPGQACQGFDRRGREDLDRAWGARSDLLQRAELTGFLLCRLCWNGACDVVAHMRATVRRTVVPMSQAAAWSRRKSSLGAAAVLLGKAYPVAGVPGAFVVYLAELPADGGSKSPSLPDVRGGAAARSVAGRTAAIAAAARAAAPHKGEKILLTGETWGAFSDVLVAELARLELPTASSVRLAVARLAE